MATVFVSGPTPRILMLAGSLSLVLSGACATSPESDPGPSNDPGLAEVERLAGSGQIMTGSASTFRNENIHRGQPGTLTEMLMRIPGIRVIDNVERGMTVRVRGSSSFVGGEEPLFVIDGMPIPSLDGALNFLNPNVIESIRVLKNADATAIYGSRGANGVILITTKGG